MYQAPSVIYPVGLFAVLRRLLCGLCLLALALQMAWWWQLSAGAWSEAGWRIALGALGLLLAAGTTLWQWRRLPRGVLRWHAAEWAWSSTGRSTEAATLVAAPAGNATRWPSGCLTVVCNLQSALLLRLPQQPGKVTGSWLWLEQAADPVHWLDVRRAIFAPPVQSPGV